MSQNLDLDRILREFFHPAHEDIAGLPEDQERAWAGVQRRIARGRKEKRLRIVAAAALVAMAVGVGVYLPRSSSAFATDARSLIRQIIRTSSGAITSVATTWRPEQERGAAPPKVEVYESHEQRVTLEEAARELPFPIRLPTKGVDSAVPEEVRVVEAGPYKTRVSMIFWAKGKPVTLVEAGITGSYSENVQFDDKGLTVTQVKVGGSEALLVVPKEPGPEPSLVWTYEQVRFELRGPVEPDTLMEIAASVVGGR